MPVGPTKVIDNTISPELILMDVAGELLQRVVLLPAWLERLAVWLHLSCQCGTIHAWLVVVGVMGLLPLHMPKMFGVLLTIAVPTTDVNIGWDVWSISWRVEMSCRWRRHHFAIERRWNVGSQWSWILGELSDTSWHWCFDE